MPCTCTMWNFIANESGERTREPDEAAENKSECSLKVMQKKSQIAQLDFCLSDFRCVSEIVLAILGCSRMLLIFGTSQSEHNSPLWRREALKCWSLQRFYI